MRSRQTAAGPCSAAGSRRFGVSWQIVPEALPRMMKDKDRAKAKRVMEAMVQMVKLDVSKLERAYEGAASTDLDRDVQATRQRRNTISYVDGVVAAVPSANRGIGNKGCGHRR